jgi:hypothetical protein
MDRKMVSAQTWIEDTLLNKIIEMATKQELTVSSWIRRAIKEKIERDLPSRPQ